MISAIILAAGMSTRLGRPKQLLSLGRERVIEKVVANVKAAEIGQLLLVLGYRATEIEELLTVKELEIVYNPDYQKGQSSSLITGLREVEQEAVGILCMLGDLPLVQAKTINYLIKEFRQSSSLIVAPTYQGQRGNPILFAGCLKEEMLDISGDQGARQLLTKYAEDLKEVEVDDQGVVLDIDRESDYQRILNIFRG